MNTDNPYAPPASAVADIRVSDPAPALWNPIAAARWSILFSPIFGSILHMKNWQAMGEPEKARTSKNWAMVSVLFFVVLVLVSAFLPDSKALDGLSRIAGLALLIAWYYSVGKQQSIIVVARYGSDYPRKGWLRPLAMAVGLFAAFIVVMGLVGFVIGLLGSGG